MLCAILKTMQDKSQLLFYKSLPTGKEYIDFIFSKDSLKEDKTLTLFKNDIENKSFQTYETVGDLMGILYKLSTCGYGCRGGSHTIEYISGRAYNLSISALKLLRIGFYDEALSLIRSISEIINLFCLFRIDTSSYEDWLKCSTKDRIYKYTPSKVRKKLTDLNVTAPVSFEYYSKLCETGVHVTPETKPSGYNEHSLALVGGFVIEHAPSAILNDLANNIFFLILMASSCILPKDKFMELTEVLKTYENKIGGLNIENLEEHIAKVKKKSKKN